ncbi:MAG: hypothetical protein M3O46_13240, partial [Myxococcota bacterium]|nr:hypothetical protein [Myxococcota bacterium]
QSTPTQNNDRPRRSARVDTHFAPARPRAQHNLLWREPDAAGADAERVFAVEHWDTRRVERREARSQARFGGVLDNGLERSVARPTLLASVFGRVGRDMPACTTVS